jgi:scyllo-inositol 2-dehydrogenase (NADP+)
MTRVTVVGSAPALEDYLRRCGLEVVPDLPGDVVIVPDATVLVDRQEDDLLRLHVPVLFLGSEVGAAVTAAAGCVPGPTTPRHEVRLRPGPDAGQVMDRSAGDLVLSSQWLLQDKVGEDVQVLVTASMGLTAHPVATWRPSTGVALLTLAEPADPSWLRLVHRIVRHVLGESDAGRVRVGILGYGAIGHEHSAAIALTEGLELAAVCDTDSRRLDAARLLVPSLRTHSDGEALLDDDEVDLVIVSTPPSSHSEWTLRALAAGKHVVVEKPFCLTVQEADAQIAAAADKGLSLSVYQNRRWDSDYLALKRVIRSGEIGEVFHYESFIGGYGHPCNYWHSDAAVSGGAIYDWGSHYLDWVLDLFPQEVEWVSATTHKRVWHDVTNADHSRVLIHFADGVEAEFVHSDLSAALKPKFYVLGTAGGIVGSWRHESVISRSAIGTLQEDQLAHSDAPADLTVLRPNGSGRTHETRLAVPPSPPQPFHRQLADQILSGEPMDVTAEGSRRNIAVMQAATTSASDGGRPVPLPTA